MKYFLFLLLSATFLLSSCGDDDLDESDVIEDILTPDVVGYYKGILYLPTVGYEIGLLNKPNNKCIYYRNPGQALLDTTAGQRWEGTWMLEKNGHYRATITDDAGEKIFFDDDDVSLPGSHIDGDVTFEKKQETGKFNFGKQP
jgi:hypothetical protein